jgi:hypothetical protein
MQTELKEIIMEQTDITKMDEAQLWKLAFEQQRLVTNLLAQLQQAQTNVSTIETEIGKRKVNEKSAN